MPAVHFATLYKTVDRSRPWRKTGRSLCGSAYPHNPMSTDSKKITCKRCLTSLAWVDALDTANRARNQGYKEEEDV